MSTVRASRGGSHERDAGRNPTATDPVQTTQRQPQLAVAVGARRSLLRPARRKAGCDRSATSDELVTTSTSRCCRCSTSPRCTTPAPPSASSPGRRLAALVLHRARASVVSLALVVWLRRLPRGDQRCSRSALALILGGALGNVIDRVEHGYVVDFIHVALGRCLFPGVQRRRQRDHDRRRSLLILDAHACERPAQDGDGMKILLANPRGFCAGVDRAIDIVERAIELFGAPIYVRHEVVHNRFVVERLRGARRGVRRRARRGAGRRHGDLQRARRARARCRTRPRAAGSRCSTPPVRWSPRCTWKSRATRAKAATWC